MYFDCFNEVKQLTKEMVAIPSIVRVDNNGESKVAKYIYDFYAQMAYFKENPDYLVFQQTIDDEIERHNTICMVRGTKGNSNKTIILMGHIDTVGVDDFHAIKEYAFDADALPEKLRALNISDKVNADIDSNEYMFGRGALDMKSGVAGHMAIMKYFATHPEELDGNLVHVAECDEEDNSHGIISALKIFGQWKKAYNLEYIAAINADYSTPHHDSDLTRHIYFGTIGKLLPSFYATGAESHVGHPFSGFDPNGLLSELTSIVNLNPKLTDIAQGERTQPPVSLKQTDTKVGYTVQTALSAYAYYNFFTHQMSPKDVTDIMKQVGIEAFDTYIKKSNDRYKTFCEMTNETYEKLPWETRVFTWGEYVTRLEEKHGQAFTDDIQAYAKQLNTDHHDMDLREFSVKVIQKAWNDWEYDKRPTLFLFFGSVYSAPIELGGKDQNERELIEAVKEGMAFVQPKSDRKIVHKFFYPYIADASFMAIDENLESLNALRDNMPSWGIKYIHPIEDILEVNVPVVNIGTFGYDGHTIAERVHMKHTFEFVPNIAMYTIKKLLG